MSVKSKTIVLGKIKKRTSLRLETEFWEALEEIAKRESCSVSVILGVVYIAKSPEKNFTSSVRTFIMLYFKAATTEQGHKNVSHGFRGKYYEKLLENHIIRQTGE